MNFGNEDQSYSAGFTTKAVLIRAIFTLIAMNYTHRLVKCTVCVSPSTLPTATATTTMQVRMESIESDSGIERRIWVVR